MSGTMPFQFISTCNFAYSDLICVYMFFRIAKINVTNHTTWISSLLSWDVSWKIWQQLSSKEIVSIRFQRCLFLISIQICYMYNLCMVWDILYGYSGCNKWCIDVYVLTGIHRCMTRMFVAKLLSKENSRAQLNLRINTHQLLY